MQYFTKHNVNWSVASFENSYFLVYEKVHIAVKTFFLPVIIKMSENARKYRDKNASLCQ